MEAQSASKNIRLAQLTLENGGPTERRASCYAVVFSADAGGPNVLLGQKGIISRINGQPVQPNVPRSNPGQMVIPGGGFEPNEDATTCALREFYEETGVDFRDPNVRASFQANVVRAINKGDHTNVYVQVPDARLHALLPVINQSIANQGPPDDELRQAYIITRNDAPQWLGFVDPRAPDAPQWMRSEFEQAKRILPEREVLRRMNSSFDWFVDALNEIVP
jgi:8-oxo-dGTP pyrophosphatase MutT (NUDIX family)